MAKRAVKKRGKTNGQLAEELAQREERRLLQRGVDHQRKIRALAKQLGAESLRTKQALRGLWIELGREYGDAPPADDSLEGSHG